MFNTSDAMGESSYHSGMSIRPMGMDRSRQSPYLWVATAILAVSVVLAATACGGDNSDETSTSGTIAAADLDSDGIPDSEDDDIDGDGFNNTTEGSDDSDGDGIADDRDTDSDNDGRPDIDEATGDTDGDGIPDRIDSDSDNDGTADGADPSDDEDNEDTAIDDPDKDSVDAATDNCPNVPNPDQRNRFGDEQNGGGLDREGDACDDTDNDGALDAEDGCPLDPDRTTAPCSPDGGGGETAGCFGIEGSADPDLVPVAFSNAGSSGPERGTAFFGPIDGMANVFGACVPVGFGDGSPMFACAEAINEAFPEAEIIGEFEGGMYLAVPLSDGPPTEVTLDLGNCGEGTATVPSLSARPDLGGIGDFAQTRFPIDDFAVPTDPAELDPSDIADLSTEEQGVLVEEALSDLDPKQVVEIEDEVLAEIPTEEVAALAPELILVMPLVVLESLGAAELGQALHDDLSQVPDSYLEALSLTDLQAFQLEALASLADEQVLLLDANEQLFVNEQMEALEGQAP